MILVDTSAWIAFFRGVDPMGAMVDEALELNDAALCGPVMTELRRGLRSTRERKTVLARLDGCHAIVQPARLWQEAGELGYALRRRGATVKTLDLLIAAHALTASVPILTEDRDFIVMRDAGVPLDVVPG